MPNVDELLRRQKALGDFGDFVLDHDDLQMVLDEGCRLVAQALNTDLAKVLEIDEARETALVRAGVGWRPGIVGKERLSLTERSSEAFAIEHAEPVITNDIAHETRFHFPKFLREHGVIALVNVPVFLPGRKPWGVLQVDAREQREFEREDIEFLRTYSMVLGPVVDRLQNLQGLRESEERLRLIVENARDYAIFTLDLEGVVTDWREGAEAVFGFSREEIVGRSCDILFTPDDIAAREPIKEREQAARTGRAPNVRWHVCKDRSRVFIEGVCTALHDGEGKLTGFLKVGRDATERHASDERQKMLLAELQHRVRNILAMMRSVVRRTGRSKGEVAEFVDHLEGRIDAMARTQALLTRAPGRPVDLEDVVRDEMIAQAAADQKVGIYGPPVGLSPLAAELVTLAVHELATNSVKYGALGQGEGKVTISWEAIERDGDEPELELTWHETGLSGASRGAAGFGTELITHRVPYELRGRGELKISERELVAAISFPLEPGFSILDTQPEPWTAKAKIR